MVERESRTLATSLLSEEWVVEVRAIDNEVVEDAALTADVQFVAVRSLGDRRARSEKRHVHEIAAIAREAVDDILPYPLRTSDIRGVKRRQRVSDHIHGLGCNEP